MSNDTKHISVCICTYRRPHLLRRLLETLVDQKTNGLFSYSIVVADNDCLESAKAVVHEFANGSVIPIKYCVEPQRGIALARNKVVENSEGDFVAFIDDDEFPVNDWLFNLFRTCINYSVDGVLGPVKPHFDVEPPKWILKGEFFERPTHPTGFVMPWMQTRTGNVLLSKQILAGVEQPFSPEFRAGEDQEFFRRMIEKGHVFIWCNEAVVHEVVPPSRWTRTYMLRRALLRGTSAARRPSVGFFNITKSVIAILTYTIALPFALMLGHHWFVILLVKLCDHLGKLLAVIGINPIKETYVTE